MVPHTAMCGDISVNAVSKQSTLSQVAQLPHHRLQQDTASHQDNLHCPTCTMHAAHICFTCNTGNPDETRSSCSCHASCSKECPSTNACNIPCHTCAATKIRLCPHGTKTKTELDWLSIPLVLPLHSFTLFENLIIITRLKAILSCCILMPHFYLHHLHTHKHFDPLDVGCGPLLGRLLLSEHLLQYNVFF